MAGEHAPRTLRAGLSAAGLLAVTGVAAVATGRPFLFPSLGPSAYMLATAPTGPSTRPRRVVGGHVVGVVAGLVAYHALAAGLLVIDPNGAVATSRLALSAVVAVGLTTAGMLATGLRHAPACATTLIVALGLLSTLADAAVVVVAVAMLVAAHAAGRRVQAVAVAPPSG